MFLPSENYVVCAHVDGCETCSKGNSCTKQAQLPYKDSAGDPVKCTIEVNGDQIQLLLVTLCILGHTTEQENMIWATSFRLVCSLFVCRCKLTVNEPNKAFFYMEKDVKQNMDAWR